MHFASTATGDKRVRILLGLYARGKISRDVLDAEGIDPGQTPPPAIPQPQRSRGLGDTIAKMTAAVGIKPCGGCKKRQKILNKLVPYGPPKAETGERPT